jgi:hypothetical protein
MVREFERHGLSTSREVCASQQPSRPTALGDFAVAATVGPSWRMIGQGLNVTARSTKARRGQPRAATSTFERS